MASSHSSRSSKSSKSSSQSVNCLSTAQMTGTRFEANIKAFDVNVDDLTWACWINPFSSGHRIAMEQHVQFNGVNRIRLSLSSANEPNWEILAQAGGFGFVSGSAIPTNDWTFLVGTNSVSNNEFELFVNGGSVGTGELSAPGHVGDTTLTIGNSVPFPTNFDGQLAFVKVWNTTLTSANITELYNGGIPQCFSDLSPALTGNLQNAWELASFDGLVGDELTEQVLGAKNLSNIGGNTFVVSDLQIECGGAVLSSCSATSSKSSKSSLSSVSSFNSSSSNSSSSLPSGSSQSSGNNVFHFSKFLGNSISVDGECVTFTREIFERREVRSFLGIVSGFTDCNACFSTEPCGTPNDDPTLFATFSWTDTDISKSWLGCTWTNGETKEVFANTYNKYYNSTIFPDTTGIPWDGAELWKKREGSVNLLSMYANPVRFFQLNVNNPPTTPNSFDYRRWQYQELDLKYSFNNRRFWRNTFYITYGPGPPTGDTIKRYNSVGTPVVVTGAPNPGVFNINQNRLSDNMLNGQMLFANGLRFKWVKGNGW